MHDECRWVSRLWMARAARLWRIWLEPALAMAVSGAYLAWMARVLAAFR